MLRLLLAAFLLPTLAFACGSYGMERSVQTTDHPYFQEIAVTLEFGDRAFLDGECSASVGGILLSVGTYQWGKPWNGTFTSVPNMWSADPMYRFQTYRDGVLIAVEEIPVPENLPPNPAQ